jgi:hypothetical protein
MRYVLWASTVQTAVKAFTKDSMNNFMKRNFNITPPPGKPNKDQLTEHYYNELVKLKYGNP